MSVPSDVYMDSINREVSMNMIVSRAIRAFVSYAADSNRRLWLPDDLQAVNSSLSPHNQWEV